MYSRKGEFVNIATDKNSNLILTLNRKSARFIKQEVLGKSDDDALWQLLEDHLCNGLEWVKPEDIAALTDSPIFSDVVEQDDDGIVTACDYVWWYPDYQIKNPVAELFEHGTIMFSFEHGE